MLWVTDKLLNKTCHTHIHMLTCNTSFRFLLLFLFYNIVQCVHLYNNSHINKQVFDVGFQLNLHTGNMLIVRTPREPC